MVFALLYSIGRLLKSCGLRTTSIKIDPYLNVDAGTMSPFEHGEVFVLDDGGESDLDLVSCYFATVHVWQAGRFENSNYLNLVHTFCISLTGQLRALSGRISDKRSQYYNGKSLQECYRPRAERRLPRQDSSGGTPYYERNHGLD